MIKRFAQLISDQGINIPQTAAGENQIQTIMTIVFQVAAAISVLIIVIAGLSYVISQGDPQRTNKAKDAILYAIIGLVISLLGYTIVAVVVDRVIT